MSKLKEMLNELLRIAGTKIAVVVGRDGFIIEGVSNSGELDFETVGAVLSTEIWSIETLGGELEAGKLAQGLIEYTDGVIITNLLGEEAILAVIANKKVNLGHIRHQVKKRAPTIQMAL